MSKRERKLVSCLFYPMLSGIFLMTLKYHWDDSKQWFSDVMAPAGGGENRLHPDGTAHTQGSGYTRETSVAQTRLEVWNDWKPGARQTGVEFAKKLINAKLTKGEFPPESIVMSEGRPIDGRWSVIVRGLVRTDSRPLPWWVVLIEKQGKPEPVSLTLGDDVLFGKKDILPRARGESEKSPAGSQ